MDRLRDTILGSQTPESPPWDLLSCFSVDLSAELNKTKENGNFAEVNSHYREQSHVYEKGFVVLLCIPNHRLSEIRSTESSGSIVSPNQTEETKEQLTAELKRLSSVLYEAYSLRLQSRTPSVGQQLNSKFPTSSVVNQPSDVIIKKMMDRVQHMLSYDNCSVYIFDKKEKAWIADILNYPTDDQVRNFPFVMNRMYNGLSITIFYGDTTQSLA
ncbi:hypothetical protein PHET_00632 [Paragonimus heterotremus]|uniref:Uncharacterized protein n=1 Tax=Paragonimus heterotremus TaxID=100268 RepID=A0A8J4STE5_9TREM|nr:hypothetical protein PHET_00632 [Paragonimus heterotremus]